MLIWLEGGPLDYPAARHPSEMEAITELGEAGYKGRHVVASKRELAKHFASLNSLSPRARAYFGRIYGEYTQLGSVFAISDHLVASLTVTTPAKIGGVWRVPLRLFENEVYLESITVVCENDADYEIYEWLARAWMNRNLPVCIVSARSRAGHGGSTITVIRRLATTANPMYLCLLDSDRSVPEGGEGSTARGVRRGWSDNWRSKLRVLECRELENALPLEVIIRYLDSSGLQIDGLHNFGSVHRDLADYVCMKTGENLCRFHQIDSSHAGFPRIRNALMSTSQSHPSFSACGAQCAECDCKIVPALGEGFLDHFAAWVQQRLASRALPASDVWPEEASQMAELLAKRAIALPRRQ